jgi:hypothetical protein
MPKSFEAYNDKVYMCHEWAGIKSGLTPMSMDSERVLVTELLDNIATTFKWELDTKPDFSRDSDSRCTVNIDPARPKADVILLGGSNCMPEAPLHVCRNGSLCGDHQFSHLDNQSNCSGHLPERTQPSARQK